jgi:hypothetical protein
VWVTKAGKTALLVMAPHRTCRLPSLISRPSGRSLNSVPMSLTGERNEKFVKQFLLSTLGRKQQMVID